MKNLSKVALSFFILLPVVSLAQPTLYIVRHAEKLEQWPEKELGPFQPLNDAGVETAKRLAKHFEKIKLAAVYSSPTTRTLHTSFAVAQQQWLPLDTARALMDTSKIDAFYAMLAQKYRPDQSVLLVTHSNISPVLLMKAGLPRECYDAMGIEQSKESRWLVIEGYDNLFKVENLGKPRSGCEGITRGKF